MTSDDPTKPAIRYPSSGRRPERLNQSRDVNAPLQLARGWTAGLLGFPGDIEGLGRMLVNLAPAGREHERVTGRGFVDETPALPTSDFYREWLPGYDPAPAAKAFSGLGALSGGLGATKVARAGIEGAKATGKALGPKAAQMAESYLQSSGLAPSAVKPKGGNWISQAGSPEEFVRSLKKGEDTPWIGSPAQIVETHERTLQGLREAGERPEVLAEAERTLLAERTRGAERALHRAKANTALNSWVDKKLGNYVRNEMATPEDPIRRLIQEKGVTHLPEDELLTAGSFTSEALMATRKAAGFPEEGLALERHAQAGYPEGVPEHRTRMAKGWEDISDPLVNRMEANDFLKSQYPGHDEIAEMYLRQNPWLDKVSPDTPVYTVESPYGSRPLREAHQELGFTHIIDELDNAMSLRSDLPQNMRIDPDDLKKMSVTQAVEFVAKVNKFRADKMQQARLEAQKNVDVFKEYPTVPGTAEANKKGLRWAQLNKPGQFAYESDHMGHSVRGYEPPDKGGTTHYGLGGWDAIQSGKARVYSLRDKKGEPHVTIEVKGGKPWNERSGVFYDNPELEDSWRQFSVESNAKGNRPSNYILRYPEWLSKNQPELYSKYEQVFQPGPPEIVQIKGKKNGAPVAEYLPYVQDFVRSGQWDRVGDIKNTGLSKIGDKYLTNEELKPLAQEARDFLDNSPAMENARQASKAYGDAMYGDDLFESVYRNAQAMVHPDVPYTFDELKSVLNDPDAYDSDSFGRVIGYVQDLKSKLGGKPEAKYAAGGLVVPEGAQDFADQIKARMVGGQQERGYARGGWVKKGLKTLFKGSDEAVNTARRGMLTPAAEEPLAVVPKNAPVVAPSKAGSEKAAKPILETPISRRTLIKSAGSQAARGVLPKSVLPKIVDDVVPKMTPRELFGEAKSLADLYMSMIPVVKKVAPDELATMADRLGFTMDDIIAMSREDVLPSGDLTKEGLLRFEELFPQAASKVIKKPDSAPLKDSTSLKDDIEELLRMDEPVKEPARTEPVKEQKMLQGFYRGYAGDYDAQKAAQDAGMVFVTPQRAAGDFYANKRAAQKGLDPHLEMILADPFAGYAYGHSIPTGPTNKKVDFTKARQLAPEDVKSTTKLYADGGAVSGDDMGRAISNSVKNGISEAEAFRTLAPIFSS
jgi:hypothetical protein